MQLLSAVLFMALACLQVPAGHDHPAQTPLPESGQRHKGSFQRNW